MTINSKKISKSNIVQEDVIKTLFVITKKIRVVVGQSLQGFDIGFEQAGLLMMLECQEQQGESSLNIKDLAKAFDKNKATISRTIKALESKDFIRCMQESDDKRMLQIHLTEKGRKLVEIIQEAKVSYLNKVNTHFTQEEQSTLINLLSRLLETLQ